MSKEECDKLDAELRDCLTVIWNAYRKNDFGEYNRCFAPLYEKYKDNPKVEHFVKSFGYGLVPALNQKLLD